MMLYERNNGTSSNHSLTFDTGKNLLGFECHSIALNNQETRLLLVGNHELAFINFETITSQIDSTINNDSNTLVSSLSDIKLLPLFDACNINRPVVEWNHSDPNQYAVAIDRFVRIYNVDHTRINETNVIIDSHHQRPISTISYSPHDPYGFLTGSLDGQIQIWDTRQCSPKAPAALKFAISTPFSIRRIQWSSAKTDNINQLAVQCDRCVRIYDIRRIDSYPLSATDLEHTQRIVSMDWTMQNHSIATLSIDQTIKIYSTNGHVLAESLPNEQSPYTFNKMKTTNLDNLFICASRDILSSTYGFVGWRWDKDQYLRPLNDRIISTTPSSIVDFSFIKNSYLTNLFNNYYSSRFNDESTNRFILLTWCRDGRLYLVDMDSTFRQTWLTHSTQSALYNLSDSTSSLSTSRTSSLNLSRQQQTSRRSSSIMTMDVIKDEAIDGEEIDDDDNAFQAMLESPPNELESAETSDDNDISTTSDLPNDTKKEVTIENEFHFLHETYGPYITVETKDNKRRLCIIRCIYSLENSSLFRIYLQLPNYYPIISQLSVRFKLSTIINDERLKSFQSRIQLMLDETSNNCFYRGQLCLHKCLLKLKNLFDLYYKQEKFYRTLSTTTTNNLNKKREQSSTNSEFESINGLINSNTNTSNTNNNTNTNTTNNNNRPFGTSSSSTRTSDSQLSGVSFAQTNRRTCGARFSGSTHLICFGRISNNQQINSVPVLTTIPDSTSNRPQSLPMRSISLITTKTRENSSTDEQSNYRPTPSTTTTNTVQIQSIPNNQRIPMSSAPARSLLATSVTNDHPRITTNYRRSSGQIIHPHSTVSIYDVSILLPVSKKLADEYKIDFNNLIEMCETNQQITEEMGKDDLTHCWRLLDGLLSIQPNLRDDDSWFQTPIAQGLIQHLVSNYVLNGDIQSASMFLLTMSQTPYLKTKIQSKFVNEHNNDPILYAYASLLHRWKHFYKRTQILSQIDHNCQTLTPFNQIIQTTSPSTTTIICSICLQPVLGQHFLCAVCGHGGHLTHMHDWFSSEEMKHKFCPEKDCTCRCIIKQQELLTTNTVQIQQQTSTTTPRSYFVRQPSGNIRSLQ